MTKLIVQIPCFNEAQDLQKTLSAIPEKIEGIDTIEVLVVDDGSTDQTVEIARQCGVDHIVEHRRNRGLAAAFQSGLQASLGAGADIIVNTDADGQYEGQDIAKLVQPILAGQADVVIGDRDVGMNEHFGPVKRLLQRLGSWVVRRLSATDVPDAVSGFRAIHREAALKINIISNFSYTTDMLIQAGRKRLSVQSVPVRTNKTRRPSRLFHSIPEFIAKTLTTILRVYATYNPLQTFAALGLVFILIGLMPIVRFLWFWLQGDSTGHVQSLILGGALFNLGMVTWLLAILAELIGNNRKLSEQTLEELRRLETRVNNSLSQSIEEPQAEAKVASKDADTEA